MTNFNERIAELADLEAKATPGEWEGYDLSFCDQFIEQRISSDKGEMPVLSLNRENSENNQQFICALRNEALPLLREMQDRIADLEDDYLYAISTEQDQIAENKRLQAENERLRAGIGRAVEYLQHQFGYDDALALEQEFRQISFGDVTEFMDFMKELEALHDA